MAIPYVGEIKLFAGNFEIQGWVFCDGRLLPIDQYDTLFNLIGTTYGGDGSTTFAVPDLRGRVPIHQGTGPGRSPRVIGTSLGTETETLLPGHYPLHTHAMRAGSALGSAGPAGGVLSGASANVYGTTTPSKTMGAQGVGQAPGGSQAHNNMSPSIAMNYIIATVGIFPSQS